MKYSPGLSGEKPQPLSFSLGVRYLPRQEGKHPIGFSSQLQS